MVFGCECIPHLSPMTHNEQDTHESFGVALIMVMSFVDLSSPKSPLAFVVTVNDCAFKIVILLLVSLSSLLCTVKCIADRRPFRYDVSTKYRKEAFFLWMK